MLTPLLLLSLWLHPPAWRETPPPIEDAALNCPVIKVPNVSRANSKAPCHFAFWNPPRDHRDGFGPFFPRKFLMYIPVTALSYHVPRVVQHGAYKHMVRIDAAGVVAFVAKEHAVRDFSHHHFINHSMCVNRAFSNPRNPYCSVSVGVAQPGPFPASRTFGDIRPNPLFKRLATGKRATYSFARIQVIKPNRHFSAARASALPKRLAMGASIRQFDSDQLSEFPAGYVNRLKLHLACLLLIQDENDQFIIVIAWQNLRVWAMEKSTILAELLTKWLMPSEPPISISDLSHFPSADMCDRQLAFLAYRRSYLDGLRTLYADAVYAPWFEDAVADVEGRRLPWETLREAYKWSSASGWRYTEWNSATQLEYVVDAPSPGKVREKLAELRQMLGPLDYQGGRMTAVIGPTFWRRAD